ncbi:Phage integrase family protein [Streptomyces sp. TLI_105]|nr:Phage integrase family protein [Streptomyces sp. TLI_105]
MRQEVPPLLFGDADDPFQGVVPPEYIPNRITIPTLEEIHAPKEVGSKALVVIIDLMSGCGHRNGEAFAANLEGMVANDVYRITEQIEGKARQRSPLKHRRADDFREVPMPATVRESLLSYAHDVGADQNGFLLRTQRSAYRAHTTLDHQWSAARKRAGITRKLNPYSLRHFFASNCPSRGIPITDAAEWMGHSNTNMAYRIYRHLMPASIGRAAKVFEAGLSRENTRACPADHFGLMQGTPGTAESSWAAAVTRTRATGRRPTPASRPTRAAGRRPCGPPVPPRRAPRNAPARA